MPGELETILRKSYAVFDEGDVDAAMRLIAPDVQAVDEISRQWIRGPEDLRAYMAEIERTTVDIHTVISDVRETIVGDVGWVTCWLEQDATVEGERSHVVGPASLVFRREDGVWLISLFHSVALPQT